MACCHRPPPRMEALESRGGCFMARGCAGSTPSESAGRAVGDEVDPQDLDGQQRQRQAQERRQHHDHDLGRVGGQQVAHEAADVGVDAPPLLDRRDDGGEVVVLEDHVRGFLGDVGAGDAHGHADVRLAQRRRVVHAVTGHGHDRALLAPGIDDAQLLLGVGAGVDADARRPASAKLLVGDLRPARPR